jgi:hypothetical protein
MDIGKGDQLPSYQSLADGNQAVVVIGQLATRLSLHYQVLGFGNPVAFV